MLRRLVLLAAFVLLPWPAAAQGVGFDIPRSQPSFLILEQERLLSDSRLGREIIAVNEAEAQELREEGQRLDLQFEQEERMLSERRDTLDPEAFRELADAFDEKVVATRREQDEKAQALAERSELRRRDFFRRVGPVLLEILEVTGASAVIEQRWVLVSKQELNITDEVIARLDAAYADNQASGATAGESGSPANGQE